MALAATSHLASDPSWTRNESIISVASTSTKTAVTAHPCHLMGMSEKPNQRRNQGASSIIVRYCSATPNSAMGRLPTLLRPLCLLGRPGRIAADLLGRSIAMLQAPPENLRTNILQLERGHLCRSRPEESRPGRRRYERGSDA